MLSADGQEHAIRHEHLKPALEHMKINEEISNTIIKRNLTAVLKKHSLSGQDLNLKSLASYLAFDCLCSAAFNYNLNATLSEIDVADGAVPSSEGAQLYQAIQTLLDAQAGQGLYASLYQTSGTLI